MIDSSKWLPAEQLVEVMTRIYKLRLTTPSGGNISMMDDEGNVWLTPSQIDKGRLQPSDIVKICPDGSIVGKHDPTSEYPFHLGIYNSRPDIKAIVHSHPCALVAFSITNCNTDFRLVPALLKSGNLLGFTSYCIPGSDELAKVVSEGFSKGNDAIIMENHGIITSGANLLSAFQYLENLEALATIYLNCKRIGSPIYLSDEQLLRSNICLPLIQPKNSGTIPDENEQNLRKELVHYMKRAYSRNLSTATSGCWSVRIDKNSYLIVPEGIDANYLETSDIVRIKSDGLQENNILSHYFKLHQSIYNTHSEVNAICCAMPVFLMAFAVSDASFDTRTIPESYIVLQNVPELEFDGFYTNVLEIQKSITNSSPCAIVQNECFLATGSSLFQVFDRVEVAEFTAQSIIDSRLLGPISPISEYAISALKRRYLSD